MNDNSPRADNIYKNPGNEPLEDLYLEISNNGTTQKIPALDKHWVEKKYFLNYEQPTLYDSEGRLIIGAKEQWLELANYIIDDLTSLTKLPFYKFWSNVVYNSCIIDSLVSFLQEAPTFFTLEEFPEDYDIKEKFNSIRRNVLIVFVRLSKNKESSSEYISKSKYAYLLYNKYIFTAPILIDLCQQYGRDNRKVLEKIINSVLTIQPLYNVDLVKSAAFIVQALADVERRFENCPAIQDGRAVLLTMKEDGNHEINLVSLEDMILYLLDMISSISILMDIYPPTINNFKTEEFLTKIVSVYGNSMPEMYKKLENLAFKDETIAKYFQLRHRLDVTRTEILNVFRIIVQTGIKGIIEKKDSHLPTEIGEIIEDYLSNLIHTLSEKEFVIDYYTLFPIVKDFELLMDLYPDLDILKYQFIVDSVFSSLEEPRPSLPVQKRTESKSVNPSTSKIQISQPTNILKTIEEPSNSNTDSREKLVPLIYEIKDVLCDLGEGFIEKCLVHYNYNAESVINAVLEDSLPSELKTLDHTLPMIPPDPDEASAVVDAAIGVQRLNIFDNDEFDIMTKDNIDTSKVHKGKRKDKYKNLSQLLDDKSHIAEAKSIYEKYNIISSEYDDEYDDTYDDQDVGPSAQDDVEVDARPFTVPRVLRKPDRNDFEEVEEMDTVPENQTRTNQNFVEDPAVLRARAEERRLANPKFRSSRNVVGNPKGQGQTKEVVVNRNQKNKNKSSGANHNRRAGSQWKRSHGMVPS